MNRLSEKLRDNFGRKKGENHASRTSGDYNNDGIIIEVIEIMSLEEIYKKGLDRRKRENVDTDKKWTHRPGQQRAATLLSMTSQPS